MTQQLGFEGLERPPLIGSQSLVISTQISNTYDIFSTSPKALNKAKETTLQFISIYGTTGKGNTDNILCRQSIGHHSYQFINTDCLEHPVPTEFTLVSTKAEPS